MEPERKPMIFRRLTIDGHMLSDALCETGNTVGLCATDDDQPAGPETR